MEAMMIRNSAQLEQYRGITPDVFQRFVDYLDASPRTVDTYRRAIRQFFKYTSERGISHPTRADVLAYRDYLAAGHKATTVQNYITALRLFFQWTEIEGIYPDISRHIKGAKISREFKKDYLTSSQVHDILASMKREAPQERRDYAIFALMVTCGLRDIEVHRANIEDLRTLGDSTVLYICGKGRSEKAEYVKVMPQVESAIRASLADRDSTAGSDPLFISLSNNSKGQRITTRSISGIIKKTLKAAGYDSDRLTAHSLRHTAVTLALLGGNSLQEVQQFARHQNIQTTEVYAHNLERAKNHCEQTIAGAIF